MGVLAQKIQITVVAGAVIVTSNYFGVNPIPGVIVAVGVCLVDSINAARS